MKERTFIRQQRRLNADFNRKHGWTKAILVEALRNVQHVCPPRPLQQSKADLERIVRGVLALDDGHPLKVRMQSALAAARSYRQ